MQQTAVNRWKQAFRVINGEPVSLSIQQKNYPNPLFCDSGVRIVPIWWRQQDSPYSERPSWGMARHDSAETCERAL